MDIKRNYEYLLSELKSIKGVGLKTSNLLKRKKINSIFDLLWKLPKSYTDRSLSSKIKDLKIDEIQTITIIPQKYSFPRVRNLPIFSGSCNFLIESFQPILSKFFNISFECHSSISGKFLIICNIILL